MPAERYYIDTPLKIDLEVSIEGEEANHLAKVMRGRVGDEIEIVNGRGVLAEGIVDQVGKNSVLVHISKIIKSEKPPVPIIIAQGFPRLNRIDIIVEKGTELGMTELWFFPGDQSEKKDLSPTQRTRFKNIAISAMKQCGCLFLPEIVEKQALSKWKDLPFDLYYGDVSPDAPTFTSVLNKGNITNGIVFIIGPEKGFSKSESAELKNLRATGVSLHQNILRTDTAPLCALSQISPFMGH